MSSQHFLAWYIERRIDAIHIQPGKPTQNPHVESLHGRLRDECLNVSWFWHLFDARRKIAAWRVEYNCASTFRARVFNARGVCAPDRFAFRGVEYHTSGSAARLSLTAPPSQPSQLRP